MREITARNLAAALTWLGADVESALLELSVVSPSLDGDVRKALYQHCAKPVLRYIADRRTPGLYFIESWAPKTVCAMHAVDAITRILDDESVVAYLRSRFQTFDVESLVCQSSL